MRFFDIYNNFFLYGPVILFPRFVYLTAQIVHFVCSSYTDTYIIILIGSKRNYYFSRQIITFQKTSYRHGSIKPPNRISCICQCDSRWLYRIPFYRYIGHMCSAYVTIPCIAPIVLGGFYSFNRMNFYKYMEKEPA